MAIHIEQKRAMGHGAIKTIDQGAIDMILDNLQKSQYTYPIKSTIREIVCNGIDSTQEKIVAKHILQGIGAVSDYFVDIEGEVYKDSKFDPEYYDLNWLSQDNTVEINYIVGGNMTKDKLVITDHGVGLGGNRLKGYFTLGYSTKRLSKLPVGKFGIGGKAPLSTGVDFYTMESNYNGRKFRFNIYSSTYDSIIPEYNFEKGVKNKSIVFHEGTVDEYKVYYEDTDELNSVSITIETKKHHKQQYIEAVKSQLLYFDGLKFTVTEDGVSEVINYYANILYEDDFIVLSRNNYYSKPHLLLNKVNYGYINFDELELEDKAGNIGIKVEPESIDVNPSRETVTWTDRTKETILERFRKVTEIATNFINAELQENDYLKWIRSCYSITSKYRNNGGVLDRLAKIVDLSSAKIKYARDPRVIFYKADLLNGLYAREVIMTSEQRANKYRNVVKRKEVKLLDEQLSRKVILMDSNQTASNRKDKYLLSLYPEGLLAIYCPFKSEEEMILAGMSDEAIENYKVRLAKYTGDTKYATEVDTWNYICESVGVLKYEEVEVPEDFKGTETEEEEKVAETAEEVKQEEISRTTAEERRKLDGKILLYSPEAGEFNLVFRNGVSRAPEGSKLYTSYKMEYPIKEINNWDAQEIYYYRDGEDEMMNLAAMLMRDTSVYNQLGKPQRYCYNPDKMDPINQWKNKKWFRLNKDKLKDLTFNVDSTYYMQSAYNMQFFFDNRDLLLVKASKANLKYLRDFRPLQEFFIIIKNNTITMSNLLVKWNTARMVRTELNKLAFLFNFQDFNMQYHQMYTELTVYVDSHYRDVANATGYGYFGLDNTSYGDLVTHLDNVAKFQQLVASNDNPEEIAVVAKQLFGNPSLTDGMAFEPYIISKLKELLEYAQACGPMFNEMFVLTGYMGVVPTYNRGQARTKVSVPEVLEQEIKLYLEYKRVNSKQNEEEANPMEVTDNSELIEAESIPV